MWSCVGYGVWVFPYAETKPATAARRCSPVRQLALHWLQPLNAFYPLALRGSEAPRRSCWQLRGALPSPHVKFSPPRKIQKPSRKMRVHTFTPLAFLCVNWSIIIQFNICNKLWIFARFAILEKVKNQLTHWIISNWWIFFVTRFFTPRTDSLT